MQKEPVDPQHLKCEVIFARALSEKIMKSELYVTNRKDWRSWLKKEGSMPEEKPFMYTDMSERDFIKWNPDYSMGRVLATWDAIPERKVFSLR